MEDEYSLPERHLIAARITAENPDAGFQAHWVALSESLFNPHLTFGVTSPSAPMVVCTSSPIHSLVTSSPLVTIKKRPARRLCLRWKGMVVRGEIRTAVEYCAAA